MEESSLKCLSCRAVMSTRWSRRLLLLTICVSKCEILIVLKVDSVNAADDMPRATKSRKRLSRVTTSCCGSASSMFLKLLCLSARQERLSSATSSTCVLEGSGQMSMYR